MVERHFVKLRGYFESDSDYEDKKAELQSSIDLDNAEISEAEFDDSQLFIWARLGYIDESKRNAVYQEAKEIIINSDIKVLRGRVEMFDEDNEKDETVPVIDYEEVNNGV